MAELNGDIKVVLLRLDFVDKQIKEHKRLLTEVRDHQLRHTLCPNPGLCITLREDMEKFTEEHTQIWSAIRKLQLGLYKAAVIASACTMIGGAGGWVLKHLLQHQ